MPLLYIIAADRNTLQAFDPSDVDEALYHAGLTRDPRITNSTSDAHSLRHALENAGFRIQVPTKIGPDAFSIGQMTNDQFENAQAAFFAADLEALKRDVAKMAPKEFATVYALSSLRDCLDKPLGNYVWLDMGTGGKLYTKNEAIRHLYPRYSYYIHRQVLLID